MPGALVTIVLFAHGAMAGSNEDLFWSLFAASAVLFVLPYIGAVGSFYRLRQIDPDRERPFRVSGGIPLAALISIGCIGMLIATVVLFMYVPGVGFDWPVVIGSGISIALGEVAIWYSEHERNRSSDLPS